MKRNARHIAVLFETMISFSLLVFVTDFSHASPEILTDSDMERYGLAFLRSYNETLEDNFRSTYRKYFSFYANYPYRLDATISTSQGAALEFVPSEEGAFESRAIDYRIDLGVFADVDLNITSLDAQNATVLIYSGPPGSIFLLEAFATVIFSNMIIITNKGHLAELSEGSLLILSQVKVNEKLYHLMIARGSNAPSAWTDEQAEKDAKEIFEIDLYRAFNQSEEVREYLAYPELSELVGQVVWRYQHARETGYDLIAFRDDLAKIRDLARDKYHVKTEFVDEILTYLQGVSTSAPPPFWEVAPWSWVLSGIVSAAIGAICVRLWSNFKGKRKRKQKAYEKKRKQSKIASTRRGSR
jgi:hypothetical protein